MDASGPPRSPRTAPGRDDPASIAPAGADSARRTTIAADLPIDPQRLARTCAPAQVRCAGTAYLHSTYFDTAGLTLVSAGYSLRYRTNGADASWTLSCPDGAEHQRAAPAGVDGVVPADLRSIAGAELHDRPVTAFLAVSRVDIRYEIRDADGAPAADLVEDTVEAVHLLTGASIGCWRRVQIDLAPDADEALVGRIERQVRAGS